MRKKEIDGAPADLDKSVCQVPVERVLRACSCVNYGRLLTNNWSSLTVWPVTTMLTMIFVSAVLPTTLELIKDELGCWLAGVLGCWIGWLVGQQQKTSVCLRCGYCECDVWLTLIWSALPGTDVRPTWLTPIRSSAVCDIAPMSSLWRWTSSHWCHNRHVRYSYHSFVVDSG